MARKIIAGLEEARSMNHIAAALDRARDARAELEWTRGEEYSKIQPALEKVREAEAMLEGVLASTQKSEPETKNPQPEPGAC